jgi:hypothetical protein
MRFTRLLAAPLAVVALSSCATEIIEAELTTTTSIDRPAPTGDAAGLLDQLRESFQVVSTALADDDRSRARDEIEHIEAIWGALEPQIVAEGEQYVEDVRRVIDLAVSAVERNRPADAGKALRFVDFVIDSFAS